jgi:Xaa-Pro aminopeptidase
MRAMGLPDSVLLAHRHARVRGALDGLNVEALVVTEPANIRYLSNHVGSAGVLVMARDAVHLLIDFRYQAAVRELQDSPAACPGLRTWNVPGSYDEALVSCLAEIGVSAVGFEATHMSVARHDWLTRTLSTRGTGITLRPSAELIEQARMLKDAAEIALLREAAARLEPVVEAAVAAVGEGAIERNIAAVIEASLRDAGFDRPAFDTIVASGPNSALPHYRAGSRALTRGDLVVLDFGGVLGGYCSDLTRTVAVGPPEPEALRVHTAVLDAQQAAVAAVRPGVDASSIDAAARDVLERHGLGEAFGHGTGHGLGLDVHELPRIARPRADIAPVTLAPGMVFTIEPGAYRAGWGGVRIEDDVLVTETGCDVLTTSRRDLQTR